MAELICPKCGQRVQGEPCVFCLAASLLEELEKTEHAKASGAIRAGEPPLEHRSRRDAPAPRGDAEKKEPTLLGCLLVLVCTAVILGSALPVVMWRDPTTGLPLPRMIAIATPLVLGAICYAIGAGLLRLFGLAETKNANRDGKQEASG